MSTQTARRRALTSAAVVATATAATIAGTVPAQAAPQDRSRVVSVRLTGDQIPADAGEDGGKGGAVLRVNPKKKTLCYVVGWRKLSGKVVAMHLHQGERGETGPHVVDLFDGLKRNGKHGAKSGCVQVTDGGDTKLTATEKIRAILDEPEDLYLNLHTTTYAKGAIRGQLD